MIKKICVSFVLIASVMVGSTCLVSSSVYATNEFNKDACSEDSNLDAEQKEVLGCNQNSTAPSVATTIINGILAILALVSVVMIIFAGQRYMVAMGDPGKITQAKNMILYGVIGLVIALLAFAIVNFIISGFAGQ